MTSTNVCIDQGRVRTRRVTFQEWIVARVHEMTDRHHAVEADGIGSVAEIRDEIGAIESRDGGATPTRWIRLS